MQRPRLTKGVYNIIGTKGWRERESGFGAPQCDQALHRFLVKVPDECTPCVMMNRDQRCRVVFLKKSEKAGGGW